MVPLHAERYREERWIFRAELLLDHPFRVELKFGNILAQVLEGVRSKEGIDAVGHYQATARPTRGRRHGRGVRASWTLPQTVFVSVSCRVLLDVSFCGVNVKTQVMRL